MDSIEEFVLPQLFDDTPSSPLKNVLTPSSTNSGWGDAVNDWWSDTKASAEPTPSDITEDDGELKAWEKVQQGVSKNWSKRDNPNRYKNVIVLLISWEEHDLGDEITEATNHYTSMFQSLYNYKVWTFKIPSRKPHLALTSELVMLAEQDSPETLFIIWYDGHGLEHIDRRGSPRWCSHSSDESQTVDSSIISTTLSDCEADILLINNACHSLTCDRFNGKGIVESISASAFNTTTYGQIDASDLSPSMTWAVRRILCDEKCVEEGITVAELHRRICLATQYGSSQYPKSDGSDYSHNTVWHLSPARTQPVYTRLSADAAGPGGKTRSIVLRKLAKEKYLIMGGGTSKHMRVRLGVGDPDEIDTKEWIDWITSAPSGVYFARVDMVDEPATTCMTYDGYW
ncbi:hypothetical protein F4678DRAFT_463309 [Xylaria arbuscula]|nr:hypothetical protein F4678DRAFT_463309 [Xylaria arbuscula]